MVAFKKLKPHELLFPVPQKGLTLSQTIYNETRLTHMKDSLLSKFVVNMRVTITFHIRRNWTNMGIRPAYSEVKQSFQDFHRWLLKIKLEHMV